MHQRAEISLPLQPGLVGIDAAGDVDREDQFEIDALRPRHAGSGEERGEAGGKDEAHGAHP